MFARLHRFDTEHRQVVDACVAIILALLLGVGLGLRPSVGDTSARLVGGLLAAAVALPLALRRRNPYLALLGSLVFALALNIFSVPEPPVVLPLALALYTIGTVGSRGAVLLTGLGTLAVSLAMGLVLTGDQPVIEEIVRDIAWVVGSLAVGYAVANRRAYVDQIRQRALEAERTKEEEAQRRVEEERIRIARDVHDGVAHALASISLQAGAADAVFDTDPAGARRALKAIRAASVSALSELRLTVGTLRHQGDGPAAEGFERDRVDRLADVLRAEGIRVSVHGEAYSRPLAGEVGIAAQRILQEALTNVLRHSGARKVDISFDRVGDDLVLVVTDDGAGLKQPGANPGYGLVGMRERAEALGGRVEHGPGPRGGFVVRADLPIERRR